MLSIPVIRYHNVSKNLTTLVENNTEANFETSTPKVRKEFEALKQGPNEITLVETWNCQNCPRPA